MKNLSDVLVHLQRRGTTLDRSYLSVLRDHCLVCEEPIGEAPLYLKYRVCPHCRFHYSITARERIELLTDQGSFKETNQSIETIYPVSFSSRNPYPRRLSQDQTRTGLTEAAVTGRCTIGGTNALMLVLDFGFMGGSMGSVVGEKVALAFETAAHSKHPLVGLISGGGARIQEGVLSLMQMAKTVTAANQLREKGVPFVVVLSNPATGQAYASFANLGDLILAEPGSLIGLAPMKTLREASRMPIPLDAHTAEAHLSHGLIDNVLDREMLKENLGAILDILSPKRSPKSNGKCPSTVPAAKATEEIETQKAIEIARHPERPSALDYINSMVNGFIELKGDRVSGDDRTVVGGLGSINSERVMIIGQQKTTGRKGSTYHTYPEGFRKARRLIDLAARFDLPVVTLVDTQGAHPGLESEEQGVGNAIATTLSLMAEVPTPTTSVIVGQGGSEAALALGMSDSLLMQEYAIYTPISPGETASRLYRSVALQSETAQSLILTSQDCKELGIIDKVVLEPEGGAQVNPQEAASYLASAISAELAELTKTSPKKLVKARHEKFRRMGEYSSYSQAAVRREISLLQHIVLKEPKGRDKKGARRKR